MIKLFNPSIQLIKKKININIQEIKKRIKRTVPTIIKIEKRISDSYKQSKINYNIPIIEKTDRKSLIPLILKTEVKFDENQLVLNDQVPKIEIIDIQKTFDTEKDKIKESQSPIQIEQIEYTLVKHEEVNDEDIGKIKKEMVKNVFGINSRKLSRKPIIILLKDQKSAFIGSLEEILLRIYREIKGGFPKPRKITKIEKFIRELERFMKAEDKIFTVDFQKNDYKEIEDWDIIRDVLAQLYSQDLGFIIFKNLDLNPDQYIPRDHKIKILSFEPNDILSEDLEAQKELCRIIWGLITLKERDFDYYILNNELTFDNIFNMAKEKYEKYFNKIQEPFLTITRRSKGGRESEDVHFNLKLFITRYLSNCLGFYKIEDLPKILEYINTEAKFSVKDRNIFPDIYISKSAENYSNEVFEIETLFGQGSIAIKKIDETIEKYENTDIAKLNIVLENYTLINHLKEIKKKIEVHKKFLEINQRKFNLEFWGLDLAENKLIRFNEIENKLKKLKNGGYLPIFLKQ